VGSVILYSILTYMLLLEDVTYASNVFGTIFCSNLKAMLFSLFGLEPKLVLLFVKSFVILFSLQLHVCDVYLLNHAILVVKLIYRGHS
jgi:hypothetical protein